VENFSIKPCLAKYSKQILKTLLILSIIAMYFLYTFLFATTTLLQAQASPKVLWVSRVPDNRSVLFISYAYVKNELVLYAVSPGGITFLRLSNGEILRYVKLETTPVFALPIPYLYDGYTFMTTDIVVGVAGSLLRISSINGSITWAVNLSSTVKSGAIAGDADGDGIWDIIAGDSQGNVYLVSGNSGKILWSRKTGSAPVIGIATKKPVSYIHRGFYLRYPSPGFYVYSGSSSSKFVVTAFNPDGSVGWTTDLTTGINSPQEYASYIDVVEVDTYKYVAVATDSSIIILDGYSGYYIYTMSVQMNLPHIVSKTLRNNFDIVVGAADGVCIIGGWWPLGATSISWCKPIGYVFSIDLFYWGNLDEDNLTEIIVASIQGVYMLDGGNGDTIWFYKPGSLATSVGWSLIQDSEQDIDGDGYPDPIVGTSDGYIMALSASNLVTTTSPTATTTPAPISMTVTKTVTITSTQTVSITMTRLYTTISTTTVFTTTPLTITLTSPYTTTFTQFVPTTTTLHKTETQTLTTTTTIPTTITTAIPTTITVREITYTPTATITIEKSLFSEETTALTISITMIVTSALIGIKLRRR
jgi:hypothetical protein